MSRTIKFRAWDKEKKTMIYETPTWTDHDGWRAEMFFFGVHPDDLSELMQFTDLHDKNGKEIYEGDIVHCEDEMYTLEKVWRTDENKAITFENGGFRFDGLVLGDMIGANPLTFEVIGNVYESPELLKSAPQSN